MSDGERGSASDAGHGATSDAGHGATSDAGQESATDSRQRSTTDSRQRPSTDSDEADPTVLFTGFPGFLGSALVERLLERGDGPVACLVQPHFRDRVDRRAAAITGRVYGDRDGDDPTVGVDPDPTVDASRDPIRVYEGDITDPGIGLDADRDELGSVESLYHLAAVYDLGVDADLAEAVNVRGTEHVLDVAGALDVDRFHYVSTCYVSGRFDGVFTESDLEEGQSFNNHYERTKYEAEVRVRERMDAGLPATIYRPAIAVGDSESGATDKYDGVYYLIRLLLAQSPALSLAPTLPGSGGTELNVVPRDFVVDAIAHLSGRDGTAGETYQLCDPAPLPVPAFVDAVGAAAGHRVVDLPVPKSVAKRTFAAVAARGAAAEPATVDYLDHPTRYACPNARRALAGSGVECPPFRSYVDRIVAYVREHPTVGDDAMV